MNELGNMILLLDDDYISQFKVKFIIVGVPNGLKEYYRKVDNLSSIANRLSEIDEVSKLNKNQVDDFVKKGFIDELKVSFESELLKKYQDYIYLVTDGIPQRMHEFCEFLAEICEENEWEAKETFLETATKKYIKEYLVKNYTIIQNMMNSKETTVGRRNQVLYALGRIEKRSFTTNDVEEIVKREFPISTSGVTLGIGNVLREIERYEDAPIKKVPKGTEWVFTDPLYLLCIRSMLKKRNNETVEKIELEQIS
ncbi:hypothetical protein [Bacillus sp. MMSF_3328]|uniref:hypothetical protein n=1 Tax=Bacillus sp. MMSF_3328 TaxID=3047080 RepID=UPI00273E4F89|nr:hypothetical protein [Bacillus sp. MMSF_3328]